jgi:hypothetical protein
MVATAFNIVLSDVQSYGRSKITFYLLRKENEDKKCFGYMKNVEDSHYPINIDSYLTLQHHYNDMLKMPNWHDTVEELIQERISSSTARVKNFNFMKKVREQFNLPEPVIDVASVSNSIPEVEPIQVQPVREVPMPRVAPVEPPAIRWDPLAERWNRIEAIAAINEVVAEQNINLDAVPIRNLPLRELHNVIERNGGFIVENIDEQVMRDIFGNVI